MHRKRKIICLAGLLFAVVMFGLAGSAYYEQQSRYWHPMQASTAAGMGLALHKYRVRHGVYPDSLRALVDSGQMTSSELRMRMFQAKPFAKRQEWIYQKPSRPEDIAIISPAKAIATMGRPEDRAAIISASADGTGWVGTQSWFGPGGPGKETLAPLPPER